MTDMVVYNRRHKVCHICHISAEEVREMPTCVDCGERVCHEHSEVLFQEQPRSAAAYLSRVSYCSMLEPAYM